MSTWIRPHTKLLNRIGQAFIEWKAQWRLEYSLKGKGLNQSMARIKKVAINLK